MPFEMPKTIAEVLRRVQEQEYVLPAIQREFVWDTDQIARLFDSLMRDYPIGSFLFWKIDGQHTRDLTFYGFIKDYHERDAPRCPMLDVPDGKPVTAILDGQQRLTALNIGLRGSHAEKLPWKRTNNAAAYPKKRLYLNLMGDAPENELGMQYHFEFFEAPPESKPEAGVHWFPVGRIMDDDLKSGGVGIFEYVQQHGLGSTDAFRRIEQLRQVVHLQKVINYYEETAPELEKVLDIFIRVNSGGTVLSYSDLLLSIATAQWKTHDARSEIHDFVDELNAVSQGFAFTKDVVLKAGLVLTEVSDVGFKVTNFNRANMLRLEKEWDAVTRALRLAVGFLADCGFSAATLTANSVLIPIAYYLYRSDPGEAYRRASKYKEDREQVRRWVIRTLLKPGVWGSGLDTLLRELRGVIASEGTNGFPTGAIEAAMARRGKPLTFTAEEIANLLDTSYGDRRAFPMLALLFPHVDTTNLFHVDHVFPRALFRKTTLEKAGLDPSRADEYLAMANSLPNLQLLDGTLNVEKQAMLPAAWAAKQYPNEGGRQFYLEINALSGLPDSLAGFPVFFEQRRQRFAERMATLLGVDLGSDGVAPHPLSVGGIPALSTEVDETFLRQVLTRREVSDGQRAVLRVLYEAGDAGLSYSALASAVGREQKQLDGVLGALGHRINSTPRADMSNQLSIGTFFRIWEANGQWQYRMRPELRNVCEELRLVERNGGAQLPTPSHSSSDS